MAGHNATAYPEEHLYVKSPAETEAAVLAGIDKARISYQSSEDETERAYRHRANVADPTPPIEIQPDLPEDPPPAPAPPPAPRSTKKPSSTKK